MDRDPERVGAVLVDHIRRTSDVRLADATAAPPAD